MYTDNDVRVPFADGETDTLPVEWASRMLRLLYDKHRATFGALLADAVAHVELRAVKPR